MRALARGEAASSADAWRLRSARTFAENVLRVHGVRGARVSTDDVAVALVPAAHPSVPGLLPLSLLDTQARMGRVARLLSLMCYSPR